MHKNKSFERRKIMLKQSEAFVIHPVFGKIRIEEKFAKVLQLKYFRELGLKSQLGTKSLSSVSINAKHTRLTHSIGVMYLTEQLIEACEKKFSDYFSITAR
jgi:HD superfamily phosphohydrolase